MFQELSLLSSFPKCTDFFVGVLTFFALHTSQIGIPQSNVSISFLRKQIWLCRSRRSTNGFQQSHLFSASGNKLVSRPQPVINEIFDFLLAFVRIHVVQYFNPFYRSFHMPTILIVSEFEVVGKSFRTIQSGSGVLLNLNHAIGSSI